MESSSSGSSSKRARLPSNGVIQVPVCLVDGCTADLGKCRDYHRRHRVCEVHSKTARVFIRGQEKRFCQQCSRFHSLDEFDDGKRSCRKRLDGHNRRRRKPQPPTLSMNSARLFSDHQGTRYLQFGSSQMFPTAAETSAWSTKATKPENHDDFLFNNNTNNNNSSSSQSTLNFIASNISPNCKSGKQFPFLQTDSPPPGLEPKMFSHGAIPVIETDRALSLLSSPPQPEIGLTHMVHPHPHPPHPPARPSIQQNLSYNNGCFGRGSEPADGSVLSNGSSSFHSMFQIGADDGSSSSAGSGSHHHSALSFSWQ